MIITLSTSIAGFLDYFLSFSELVFSTRGCTSIDIYRDLFAEGEETILLSLEFSEEESNVVLGPNTATVVIKDSKWFFTSIVRNS